jgi:hypothetical protein
LSDRYARLLIRRHFFRREPDDYFTIRHDADTDFRFCHFLSRRSIDFFG